MTKVRQKIMTLFTAVILLCLCVAAFAACSSGNEKISSVTFHVDEKSEVVEVNDDGSVNLPKDPVKDYYEFRGWFIDDQYTAAFDSKSVNSKDAYARFAPITLTLHVNGENVGEQALVSLDGKTSEYEAEALKENLTFDGWYTDAGYTTKYTTQDVDNLYGHYLAQVTFDNGYEVLYTQKLGVDQSIGSIPHLTVDDFVKDYMDPTDIFYVYADEPIKTNAQGEYIKDEAGHFVFNDVDFAKPVGGNVNVTVQWHTPALNFANNARSGNFTLSGVKSNAPVVTEWKEANTGSSNADFYARFNILSVPSRYYYVDTTSNETVVGYVDSTSLGGQNTVFGGNYFKNISRILIQEGVESVQGLRGNAGCVVKNVTLPSTTKLIIDAMDYMPLLESVNIPDGVTVIGNSFFANSYNGTGDSEAPHGYSFDITVPNSVQYMYQVPAELKYEEGSEFFAKDGVVYQNTENGLVFVYSNTLDNDKNLVIESAVNGTEVKGIQNSAFRYVKDLNKVYIPATVSFINYAYGFNDYLCYYVANGNASNSVLMDSSLAADKYTTMNANAYSWGGTANAKMYVFDTTEWPTELPKSVFQNYLNNDGTENSAFDGVVVFLKTVTAGEINVHVKATQTQLKAVGAAATDYEMTVNFAFSVDEVLTKEQFITKTGLDSKAVISSVTELGEEYAFGAKPTRNLYIVCEYEFDVTGFLYEKTEDGTALIVTGFDYPSSGKLGGTRLVNIPDTLMVNGEELPIVSIKEGAFEEENYISVVFIGANVKEIGNNAFKDCKNLKYVILNTRVLEIIGDSAFKNTAITSLTIPLKTMTYIGPYAFKTPTLTTFKNVAGETDVNGKNYNLQNYLFQSSLVPEFGKYYLMPNAYSFVYGIVKVTGEDKMYSATYNDRENKTVEVKVYDCDYVATAGGFNGNSAYVYMGYTNRASAIAGNDKLPVYRFTVKTGSVYYLKNAKHINFAAVKKIETNAFTDMAEKFTKITTASDGVKTTNNILIHSLGRLSLRDGTVVDVWDQWHTQEEIGAVASANYDYSADAAIFEEGWWDGVKVGVEEGDTADEIVAKKQAYEDAMEFIKYCKYDNAML